VKDLRISPYAREMMTATEKELISERDTAVAFVAK